MKGLRRFGWFRGLDGMGRLGARCRECLRPDGLYWAGHHRGAKDSFGFLELLECFI